MDWRVLACRRVGQVLRGRPGPVRVRREPARTGHVYGPLGVLAGSIVHVETGLHVVTVPARSVLTVIAFLLLTVDWSLRWDPRLDAIRTNVQTLTRGYWPGGVELAEGILSGLTQEESLRHGLAVPVCESDDTITGWRDGRIRFSRDQQPGCVVRIVRVPRWEDT